MATNKGTVQNESLVLEVAESQVKFSFVEFLDEMEDVRPRNATREMFQRCIISNLNLHTVFRARTARLIKCNHLIGSSSH